jgi:ATP/ADP translocase
VIDSLCHHPLCFKGKAAIDVVGSGLGKSGGSFLQQVRKLV